MLVGVGGPRKRGSPEPECGYTASVPRVSSATGPARENVAPPLLGRHNPRVARLRKLIRREEPELTVVDGLKLVADLADSGIPIVELFSVESHLATLRSHPAVRHVLEGGRGFLLDPATMAHLAPTRQTQGLLAVVAAPAAHVRPEGVVLYLDRVQDPGNVGSVIRCAAAFGASGVACSRGCADPFSPRAVRASAGHALLLPVHPEADLRPLAEAFNRAGGEVVGAVSSGGTPLREWRPRRPVLLVLGNEGQGLAEEVSAACARQVTVPLAGRVESLNVGVTAGVILATLSGVAGSPILERQRQKGRRG
jgi:TrmH family RNA methyltransferase